MTLMVIIAWPRVESTLVHLVEICLHAGGRRGKAARLRRGAPLEGWRTLIAAGLEPAGVRIWGDGGDSSCHLSQTVALVVSRGVVWITPGRACG